jgi:SAM-dependent methyltransferase
MSRLCRSCGVPLLDEVVDLGMQPLSNAFVTPDRLDEMEPTYPLRVFVCRACWLVQIQAVTPREVIFADDYAYFSSYSTTWLDHARRYAERMIAELQLSEGSKVVELASNDGYLLRWFAQSGINVHGIEPTAGTAQAARARGIDTTVAFFGSELAEQLVCERGRADLLVANNVLAHVPDLNDFIAGMRALLADDGLATVEFPHLLTLLERCEFDTIYHEHFSYFSLLAVETAFERHGLRVVDVERLPTHGGSLRLHVVHEGARIPAPAVAALGEQERAAGLDGLPAYARFAARIHEVKFALLEYLLRARRAGLRIVAYGAAAKGNTLLNYCGVREELIDYVVDKNPHKVGNRLPGTHIPIRPVSTIDEDRPDVVLILPWNLADEIVGEIARVRGWGGRYIVAIPTVREL